MAESRVRNKCATKKFDILITKELFIELAIILNPIIDILFNVLKGYNLFISINQIIRIGIFIISLCCLHDKKSWINFLRLASWFGLITLIQYFCGFTFSFLSDIAFVVKILSAYVIYRLIYETLMNKPDFVRQLFRACFISSVIIMLNIFLAVFGIGNRTYAGSTDRLSGYVGFLSGNCITANCMMMLFVINILHFGKRKIIVIALNFLSLILLATKFSVLGTVIIIFLLVFYEIYASPKKVRAKRFLAFLAIGLCLSVIAVPLMIDYINKLFIYGDKYGWSLFDMLTSNRGMQIDIINEYYIDLLDPDKKFIGSLFGFSQSNVNQIMNGVKIEFEAIEWDFHGVYYYLGGISLALLICFLFKILRKGFYFIKRKDRALGYLTIIFFVMIGSALLGGHVFYESMSLQYIAVICAIISTQYQMRSQRKNTQGA